MDFKECVDKKIIKSVSSDGELIKSLLKSSENKLKSQENLKMNDIHSSSKISLTYDSLREVLEALALVKGYKVYNHECYMAFLKEVLKMSNKGDEFNELRIIRNSINYYGKDVSINESIETISRMKNLRLNLLKLLK